MAFRNYLQTHPSDVVAYSNLKKGWAKTLGSERARYGLAKTDFFLSILERCDFSKEELESIKHANQT
jgi:GrpB-like predicted nucleotidyltransferase (UPF0157 family)